jgi:uncharacterized protein YuzE
MEPYPILETDREAGAAYIALEPDRKGRIARTEEIKSANPMILVDYDDQGQALGIELIGLHFAK